MNANSSLAPELAAASTAALQRGVGAASVPMSGQNIICFAKDWSEDPTSCNYVLRELAKNNRVLWLNSISTRSPNLTSGRDLRKIFSKIASLLHGATQVSDSMWVFTPFVLPFHHSHWAVVLNRFLLRITLYLLRRKLGFREFQLWTFVPTSAEYVGRLGEEMLVYYCTDEWSGFGSVNGLKVGEMVKTLATRADVVFATSRPLVDKLRAFNAATHLASHGVKYEMFAQALENSTQVPPELEKLSRPVLGYYGLIEQWLDLDLIAYLAERHPEWNIVLIGKSCVDTSRLDRFSNVHLFGRKPHSELPGYCKGMNVALIPHKVNELTRHMNPIKLREYLSAGLKIVSTDLPEMHHYPEFCIVARDYAEFEAGVATALREDSPDARRSRSTAMRGETWDRKVEEIGATVMRVKAATV
jgi:hypothetical protein